MKKILALAILATGTATANAALLAANPEDFGANFGLGFYSDGAPGQYYSQQIAENFSLGSGALITGVDWAGASEFFSNPDYTNMAAFNVQILADTGAGPGAVIHGEIFPTGATAPTFQGVGGVGSNVYGQFASFTTPFALPAGNYWVSVGAILVDPFDDAWVWADGTVDDGIAFTFNPNGGGWSLYNDGATSGTFSIHGDVPAPASLGLVGIAGLIAGRRRR